MLRTILIAVAAAALAVPAGAQNDALPPVPQAPELLRGGSYVLQVGDQVSIRVFQQPQLDVTARIRPDGRISVVLVDEVQAAGLTPEELDAQLTKQYARFFQEPEVSVLVGELANLKVFVGGEVGQPGLLPLAGELTLVSAIFQAGGFTPTARTDSVVLLRNQDGQPVAQRVNVKDLLSKGGADHKLQPFDVVYVPLSRIGAVDKFVDQYVRQLLPVSLTAGFSYIIGDRVVIR